MEYSIIGSSFGPIPSIYFPPPYPATHSNKINSVGFIHNSFKHNKIKNFNLKIPLINF